MCALQAAADVTALSIEQLEAVRKLHADYAQQVTSAHAEQHRLLAMMQQAPGTSPVLPELSAPHEAADSICSMGHLCNSFALQREAYLNLTRSFVLHILTPLQAGLLCAASYPYLINFPAIISHLLR